MAAKTAAGARTRDNQRYPTADQALIGRGGYGSLATGLTHGLRCDRLLGVFAERAQRRCNPLNRSQGHTASFSRNSIADTTDETVTNTGLELMVNSRPTDRLAALGPRLLGATKARANALLDHGTLEIGRAHV